MELLEKIELYKKQEAECQFDFFNTDVAWEIGHTLAERAKRENFKVVIDISLSGHTLFRCSLNGATGYNDHWVTRKQNTVMLQQMSSIRYGAQLRRDGKFENIGRLLDPFKYSFGGGGFPIIIKNTGVIGCITVSGLSDFEDHQIIVDAIQEYLSK